VAVGWRELQSTIQPPISSQFSTAGAATFPCAARMNLDQSSEPVRCVTARPAFILRKEMAMPPVPLRALAWTTRLQWCLLTLLCGGLGGLLLPLLAGQAGQPLIVLLLVTPAWFLLRDHFRYTDQIGGISGLAAGGLIGGLSGAALTVMLNQSVGRGAVLAIMALGLMIWVARGMRRHYSRLRRWTALIAVSVTLSILGSQVLKAIFPAPAVTAGGPNFWATLWLSLGYALLTTGGLGWVMRGRDGRTTLSGPGFAQGTIHGDILNPLPGMAVAGTVVIMGATQLSSRGTIKAVEIWIDGRLRGEARLTQRDAGWEFIWDWETSAEAPGEHLLAVAVRRSSLEYASGSVLIETRPLQPTAVA
jgi:hypothetical protein